MTGLSGRYRKGGCASHWLASALRHGSARTSLESPLDCAKSVTRSTEKAWERRRSCTRNGDGPRRLSHMAGSPAPNRVVSKVMST
ncbi:unnamed protein product, partial [Mycena citricolor]